MYLIEELKMKLLFIIIITISITSCKHKDKLEFIKNFIEHQENIVELFKTAPFDASEFSNRINDSSYIKIFKEWSDKFIINSEEKKKDYYFEIHYYKESLLRFTDGIKKPIIIIVIKSKENFKLEFNWIMYENDIWVLNSIKRVLTLKESHE